MTDLDSAVAKTMNFVFADLDHVGNETKKRLETLKNNIGKVVTLPLDEIQTNENVRKSIDTESEGFSRLLESVKKYGILENIVVELRINKKETEYKLVCIAGHRRMLAAKMAKTISKIPCLLQTFQEKGDSVGAALAENLNREDLHCLDVSEGYQELINSGWSEDDLAKHYCRDIRTIKHYLKMAEWTHDVKSILRANSRVFSTRVIMRQFAYRKFSSPTELKTAILKCLDPEAKVKKPSIAIRQPPSDKKTVKLALATYLSKQTLLSSVIKEEIQKAFVELKLI